MLAKAFDKNTVKTVISLK